MQVQYEQPQTYTPWSTHGCHIEMKIRIVRCHSIFHLEKNPAFKTVSGELDSTHADKLTAWVYAEEHCLRSWGSWLTVKNWDKYAFPRITNNWNGQRTTWTEKEGGKQRRKQKTPSLVMSHWLTPWYAILNVKRHRFLCLDHTLFNTTFLFACIYNKDQTLVKRQGRERGNSFSLKWPILQTLFKNF